MLTSKVFDKNIRGWWSTLSYPAAEPDAPDGNMVPCWCSRPDRCSAERMPWRWTTNSHAACGHSPKTLWPPFTRVGELDEAEAFRRLYVGDGTGRAQYYGRYGSIWSREIWLTRETGFYAFGRERRHEGAGKPGVRKEKKKASGETPVIKPTQFPIKWVTPVLMKTWMAKPFPYHPSARLLAACLASPRPPQRVWHSIILFSTSQCSRSKFNHISRVNVQSISHSVLNHLPILNRTIEFICFIKY
jgi:hypothetical protein